MRLLSKYVILFKYVLMYWYNMIVTEKRYNCGKHHVVTTNKLSNGDLNICISGKHYKSSQKNIAFKHINIYCNGLFCL